MGKRFDRCRVSAQARIIDAMRSLESSQARIVLLTDEGGRMLGTVTDGDLRRALLGGATLESPLLPCASPRFVSVGPEAGRAEVMDLMQARRIQQVPVLDAEGRVVGLHLLDELLGAVERPSWAVVMAGGRGTRLLPLTESLPKPMLKVAGRPILERIVLHLVGMGIRRIYLAVNYLSEVIERHFGDGRAFGCDIRYLREEQPLGTGGPLALLPESPTAPLLVLNGDLVVQFDVGQLLAFHAAGGYAATVAVNGYAHTVPFGVVELDGDEVRDVREKPTQVWSINAGIYVLEPQLLAHIPRGQPFPLPGLLEQSLHRGERVGAFRLEGEWIDVGRMNELKRARGHE
jgi:dTDP-glucose pyrophosphorylase